jgi:peroxiredoxin
MVLRLISASLAFAVAAAAADSPLAQSAVKLEQKTGQAPKPIAIEFQLRAAQSLKPIDPELSRKFLRQAVSTLEEPHDWQPASGALSILADLSPADAVALVPKLGRGGAQMLLFPLVRAGHLPEALALYRGALAKKEIRATAVTPLLGPLFRVSPDEARALLQQAAASFPDPLSPADAWWLANLPQDAANAMPELAADGYERALRAASAPGFGREAPPTITATFQVGNASINTDTTRDSVLVAAGARLRALSPQRAAKFQQALSRWDLSAPVAIRGYSLGPPVPRPSGVTAISKRMSTMRSLPSDADRTELVKALVPEIRALSGPMKLSMIRSLAGVATEGDLGAEALGMVAVTLANALRESDQLTGLDESYIELAKLVRYEHLTVSPSPTLDAAEALLELRERVQQQSGFSLTSMDGKTYTLEGLRGKIVLLNFWATWCPPCRKEMPDMEKLYRTYQTKGLTVIAVSDEDRETVVNFLAKNSYTFPIALDPGRKVNLAFSVEGIPKSFIFDREGRLAAQAIDMRTESQFLELLKLAGLE